MKQRVHSRHYDAESFELAVRVDDDALVDDVAYGGPPAAHVKGDESSHGETASSNNIHYQHSNHDVAADLVEVTVDPYDFDAFAEEVEKVTARVPERSPSPASSSPAYSSSSELYRRTIAGRRLFCKSMS